MFFKDIVGQKERITELLGEAKSGKVAHGQLFVGNEGGGKASAVIYCLSQTCRALKINPSLYFEDVLRRIQSHPYKKLHELLPQNWAPIN